MALQRYRYRSIIGESLVRRYFTQCNGDDNEQTVNDGGDQSVALMVTIAAELNDSGVTTYSRVARMICRARWMDFRGRMLNAAAVAINNTMT